MCIIAGQVRTGRAGQTESAADDGRGFGREDRQTAVRGGTIAEHVEPRKARARREAARFAGEYSADLCFRKEDGVFSRTLNPNRKKQKNESNPARSSAHVCVTGNLHRNDRSVEKISGFRFGFRNCIFGFIDRKFFLWKRPPRTVSAVSCSECVCMTFSTRQRIVMRANFPYLRVTSVLKFV